LLGLPESIVKLFLINRLGQSFSEIVTFQMFLEVKQTFSLIGFDFKLMWSSSELDSAQTVWIGKKSQLHITMT
jgi:hypothetical protein